MATKQIRSTCIELFHCFGFGAISGFVRHFSAIAAGLTTLIKNGILAGTGTGKFPVFFCPDLDGDPGKGQCKKYYCDYEKFHVKYFCKSKEFSSFNREILKFCWSELIINLHTLTKVYRPESRS